MIYVIAPGTGELVPRRDVWKMKLPIRTGWDGWAYQDKQTGKLRKFHSYRQLLAHLKHLRLL